jgi:Alginate export
VTGQYLNFWLAGATDTLYKTSGAAIIRDTTGQAGTHIGEEFDGYTWYELNRHFNVGAGVAHILPGRFVATLQKGPNFTYPYLALNFKDARRTH